MIKIDNKKSDTEKLAKAYDYIVNVLECQGRWLPADILYDGYCSGTKLDNIVSRVEFEITINVIKDILSGKVKINHE